jgi:hypothetical protein
MIEDLVILGKPANLARYDTQIENVQALHPRFPAKGAQVSNQAALAVLVFRSPGEEYQNYFQITWPELDRIARERNHPYIDDAGWNRQAMIGLPVRTYYLGHQLIGWEFLQEPKKE